MITREGDKMALRTYLEAMDHDHAEFTAALEYKLFMPYGPYKIETKDETWIMRCVCVCARARSRARV